MKIAIFTREFPHLTAWGGMANFYRHMAEALREAGHHVEVFAQGFHGEYSEVVDGITVHRVQAKHRGRYLAGMNGDRVPFDQFCHGLARQLAAAYRQRDRAVGFEVVEAHDHLGGASELGVLDVPLFLTGHTTLTVFASLPACGVRIHGSLRAVAEQEYRAHYFADRIRFLSGDLRDRTCALFPEIREKSSVVFNPCRVPALVSHGAFDTPAPEFLFVGRLEPRKGVQFIPAAVRELLGDFPGVRVTLIGQDCFYPEQQMMMSDWMKARLGDTAGQLNFLGWKPKAEVEAAMERCPYILVPSVYDNSAYAAQEGMAWGRCVLCSDAGGTKEYVGDCGVVFPANSSAALAAAMRRILLNPKTARELGAAAHARARQWFDRGRFARQFVREVLEWRERRQARP